MIDLSGRVAMVSRTDGGPGRAGAFPLARHGVNDIDTDCGHDGLITGRVCVSGGVFTAEPGKPVAAILATTSVTLSDDAVVTFVTWSPLLSDFLTA
jgi:hypothetical protein